jgi:hypothetical protein
VGRLLRLLWAGPNSLIGLALAPFFRRRRLRRGVLVCEGATWPRRLGWRYRAIAFGHVVLSVDELDARTFEHELVHVSQYERWGPLYLPAYGLASLQALVRGRHVYRDNRFEIAARAVEPFFPSYLPSEVGYDGKNDGQEGSGPERTPLA